MMKENLHQFGGRGKGTEKNDDGFRIIKCTTGTVIAIVIKCGRVKFVYAYCRKAMIDRWGVYCDKPFRRASNSDLTRTWSEPMRKDLFLFRPIRLEIVAEKKWMRRKG